MVLIPGSTESLSLIGRIQRSLYPGSRFRSDFESFIQSPFLSFIYFIYSFNINSSNHLSVCYMLVPELVSGVEWGVRRQSPLLYVCWGDSNRTRSK